MLWIVWFPGRWRTQWIAISSRNYTMWILKIWMHESTLLIFNDVYKFQHPLKKYKNQNNYDFRKIVKSKKAVKILVTLNF